MAHMCHIAHQVRWLALAAALIAPCSSLSAEEPAPSPALPNFPTVTLGGTQFWSDEIVFRGWRIQQNVLTGHYRLLDERDFRMAWGTREVCQARFDELRRERELEPLDGRAVVLLHGLLRSRDTMQALGTHLAEESQFTPINVSYASTRRPLDEHAQALARVIAGLEGIDEIHFVCHSLGNIVVRRYLGEAQAAAPRWQPDPRIKRMVMLGPPNCGAELARLGKNNKLFRLVAGPSGHALAEDWNPAGALLATPAFEFAIIAGGQGSAGGINPLVGGDDDALVSVSETRLAGARDFLVLPCWHNELMNDAESRRAIRTFLDYGYFSAEEARQPIPAEVSASASPQQERARR
jgi:hypothetical protein